MFLDRRMRRRSSALRSPTSPLSLASVASSHIFCLSRLYSLSSRRWLAVENSLSPMMDPIVSLLARSKLIYFLLADFTRSCRPKADLLTDIVLKVNRRCCTPFKQSVASFDGFLFYFLILRLLVDLYLVTCITCFHWIRPHGIPTSQFFHGLFR